MLFPKEEEDVELQNSCAVVEINFVEIPSTVSFECQMPHAKDVGSPNSCIVVDMA